MKNYVLLTALGFFFSSTSFANTTIEIQGRRARHLLQALQSAGAFVDCGAGTCGTEAQTVQCLRHRISATHRRYECSFIAQNESGGMSKMMAQGTAARNFFNALVAAHSPSSCGAGTCGTEVQAIQCLMHGLSTGHRTYECTLTP